MDRQDLNQLRSVGELATYQTEVKGRITELNHEHDGLPFPDTARSEFAELTEINKQIDERVKELKARAQIVEMLGTQNGNVERAEATFERQLNSRDGRGSLKEQDVYDLSNMRVDMGNPDKTRSEFRDRAMRAIELARFPQVEELRRSGAIRLNREDVQAHVERLVETTHEGEPGAPQPGATARHILATGSPAYRRAFWKTMMGSPLAGEEQRALSLAGSGGGFAIPFALDPSIIPTSNSVVNPMRALARLVTISGANTWQGVTSPAVAASYVAEATEASDNSTVLVQPSVTVQKAHAFIPFSIEVSEDWPALEGEFGKLLQDSKDDLEGAQFVNGVGTTVFPQGITVGATTTLASSSGTLSVAKIADIYALENKLPPRFRPREAFVANRGYYNLIRAIDTAGGAALWLYAAQGLVTQAPTPGNTGATLLGRGAWEASAMKGTTPFTNGDIVMIIGDFSYFLIVDRIGMTVELVPHIFGNANRFPIGQRGLYAYWRNSSKVLSASAFVALTAAT